MVPFFFTFLIFSFFSSPFFTQKIEAQNGYLTPPGVEGELAYIAFPVEITVDGDLSDWENIERIKVDTGPYASGDPDDNGIFDFAICADMENVYISMTMPDKKIIGGMHGTEYWNEDSFEFYFNFTDNLDTTMYKDGIVQINVNATNLEKDSPENLSLSGTRCKEENPPVTGYAFYTDDGWGIEVAFSLEEYITPVHGLAIGLQMNANGATERDRDSKLIWSKYDVSDNSWQNPRLFGTAVFYEKGKGDIPEPPERNLPAVIEKETIPMEDLPIIRVNQVGYFPDGPKIAAMLSDSETPLEWDLVDEDGTAVLSGETEYLGFDSSSWDYLHGIDFSEFSGIGTNFIIKVGDYESFPFDIKEDIYNRLKVDALHYYYYNRTGIPLEEKYAGEEWERNAFYLSDSSIKPFSGKDLEDNFWPERDYTLDAGKGWMDAGDYGKYVVNAGISVWTLLNLYERNPENFKDGSVSIPENKNDVPDILDEVRWEVDFMLGMQVPAGQPDAGMVHHKLHEMEWSPLPYIAPETTDNRYVYVPSTAATLNLAATAAMFSRLIEPYDHEYSESCLEAAEKAWQAANDNPVFTYGNIPGDGGGNYDDVSIDDEFFWAATELFITTGNAEYREYIEMYLDPQKPNKILLDRDFPISWDKVGGLAMFSLVVSGNGIDKEIMSNIKSRILESADIYLKQMSLEKYSVPMVNYYWGSNSQVLNKMIVMGYAYDITGEDKYIDSISISMDYILGRNALCKSFISGYGENPMMYPHHRWWGNNPPVELPAPPSGAIAGGPNQEASDDGVSHFVDEVSPVKRYIDDSKSYSTNEVAINWNAPLVWITSFMDEKYNSDNGVPVVRAGAEEKESSFNIISYIIRYSKYILAGLIIILAAVAMALIFKQSQKREKTKK
ncbi:MAG: glycoside hydrolase family 9 protein [Actinomycetota bacterium]|nr:glycoside hydrolase family 9 protein [Actinomycetota bacterium]